MMKLVQKTVKYYLIPILAAGALIGLCAVVIPSVSDDYRVSLLLVAMTTTFALLASKDSSRIYIIMLVVSLSFGVRFRFGETQFHQGGAEAALAPIDIPLLGLLLLWLAQSITRKQKITPRITGMGVAILLFVLVNIISVFVASDSYLALLNLLRLIKMILLVLVIRHYIKTESDLLLMISILLGTVMVQGILAVSQSFFNSSLGLGFLGERSTFWILEQGAFAFGRAGGTLGHANVLGAFFEMTLPIALAIFLWREWGRLKIVSLFALGLGLIGAFLTYSRATWVAVLLGLFVVIFVTILIQKQHRARYLRYSVIILLGVLIIGFAFRDSIAGRMDLYDSNSWKFRLRTYEIAWNLIQAHPFFGVGANNYLVVMAGTQYPAHNVFLLLAAETGFFGLLTFLFFLATIFGQAYRLMKAGTNLVTACSIGIFAGITAIMAHSMLGWALQFDPIYILFWFNVGLLLTLRKWDG